MNMRINIFRPCPASWYMVEVQGKDVYEILADDLTLAEAKKSASKHTKTLEEQGHTVHLYTYK
jgi:hypothetical protein